MRGARSILILGALALAAALLFWFQPWKQPVPLPPEEAVIEDAAPAPEAPAAFRFEIADTAEARAQGLSGRADVPPGYGLLFVFEEKGSYGFWMKDMLVPIDILWLGTDGTILGIEARVSPATYPAAFYPPVPVDRVLETRAGEAQAQGWYVGARIRIPR
jgi:uncharacterized membrane protein (UPF0127 family)